MVGLSMTDLTDAVVSGITVGETVSAGQSSEYNRPGPDGGTDELQVALSAHRVVTLDTVGA